MREVAPRRPVEDPLIWTLVSLALAVPEPMYGTWGTDYLVAPRHGALLPTPALTPHHNLGFLLEHHWSTGEAAAPDVGPGFTWGWRNRAELALIHHTARTEQVVELRAALLDQAGHRGWGEGRVNADGLPARGAPSPISLTATAGVDALMSDEADPEEALGVYGALSAKRELLGPWLSVGLTPMVVALPNAEAGDAVGVINAAIGGTLGFRPANDWGLVADVVAGVPGLNGVGLRYGVAMQGYTGGHTFSLMVGNSAARAVPGYAIFSREAATPSALSFGFSLTRDFGPR